MILANTDEVEFCFRSLDSAINESLHSMMFHNINSDGCMAMPHVLNLTIFPSSASPTGQSS
jgi:hypothetical protein